MKNNGIADFIKPTIIMAQQYGTKISVEIEHSDTDISELFDAFKTICIGLGYNENSLKSWVIEKAEEYRETDAEDLKEKLEAWKFDNEDDNFSFKRTNPILQSTQDSFMFFNEMEKVSTPAGEPPSALIEANKKYKSEVKKSKSK